MSSGYESNLIRREASFKPSTWNPETREIEITWSTGAAVRREEYDWERRAWVTFDERLSMDPTHVRLGRLNNGAPFLAVHNGASLHAVLGKIKEGSAQIVDGQGRAIVVLSKRDEVAGLVEDIASGIIRNTSVGYMVHRWQITTATEGTVEQRLADDWEPYEVSSVPMGADDGAMTRNQPAAPPPRQRGGAMDPDPKTNPGASPEQLAQVREAEIRRQNTIREIYDGLRLDKPELVRDLVAKGVELDGPDGARAQLIAAAAARDERSHTSGSHVQPGTRDEKQTRALGLRDAVLARVQTGVAVTDPMKPFMGRRLVDIGRMVLEEAGQRTEGLSEYEIAQRALRLRASGGLHSTGDFTLILGDVGNKSLLRGYMQKPQAWRPLVRQVTHRDFREHKKYQLHGAPKPVRVREGGGYEGATVEESKEGFRIYRYGRKIGLTFEAMVNDDLGALGTMPERFGRGVRNLETDQFYELLLTGTMSSDGVAICHADHDNLADALIFGEEGIDATLALLEGQTDLTGEENLRLEGDFLIVPRALRLSAAKLQSNVTPSSTDEVVPDYIRGMTVISDRAIDATTTTAYWVAAGPAQADGIELAYLEGEEQPKLDELGDPENDGASWKVRHIFGMGAIDWRWIAKNPGAAE